MIQSLIFGFGHRARHGKDSVANEIVKRRASQYDVHIYSFARELKEEVNKNAMMAHGMINLFDPIYRTEGSGYMQTNGNLLQLPDWVQYDPNPDTSDPLCPYGKQRTLLQWWGAEYRRSIDPDYWVNKLIARLEKEKPEVALIVDVRFLNEMKFCKKYGDVIKVERRNPDGSLYVAPGIIPHISEEALANIPDSNWDAIIENKGTLEDLKEAGIQTFDRLMERVVV